ncbi:MAG: asparagine synthase (glutamine-hydrolyzing) [Kiritimatiellae bacterium]|nr:asparagine synthase (glutamine-hydrolyzing) [Kiritimatiellia bacterium]
MCGIVGIFNITGCPELPTARVQAALDSMAARGPDDEGLYSGPGILLGHRRLSIIDLQGGHQPMVDGTTGTVLVFNGEIYNYRELRNELAACGPPFQTRSDTEVLLRAYLRWDTDCLAHLVGMFAFAVFDPSKRQVFLARDRTGVKPLFYSMRNGRFMFASTIPALRCFPDVRATMDCAAVSHYLTTIRTTFGTRTLLRDIRTLQPGECLTIRQGAHAPAVSRYWEIPVLSPEEKQDPGIQQAAEHAAGLLAESVRQRLVSDVPLGGFLSGGLDSTVIASLACPLSNHRFNAYAVGYAREGYNEWPFVRSAAQYYSMQCAEITLAEQDYRSDWATLTTAKGLPLSTPNEVAIFHLARALRRDFTVALSGEGADEVFGGYSYPFFSAYDYERARHAAPQPGTALSTVDRAIMRLYRRPYLLCRPDHFFLVNSWVSFADKKALLTPDVWQASEEDREVFQFYEDLFTRLSTCSTFDAYMHVHARINLEGLLARVDSSTMAASVEARVPFTDHRVVEFLFGLPDHYKIDWRNAAARRAGEGLNVSEIEKRRLIQSKILLRRAFAARVPQAILHRAKMSFPVPFREWFGDWMRNGMAESVRGSRLLGPLFRPERIRALLAAAEQPTSAMALWPVTNLCLWQQLCGAELP